VLLLLLMLLLLMLMLLVLMLLMLLMLMLGLLFPFPPTSSKISPDLNFTRWLRSQLVPLLLSYHYYTICERLCAVLTSMQFGQI